MSRTCGFKVHNQLEIDPRSCIDFGKATLHLGGEAGKPKQGSDSNQSCSREPLLQKSSTFLKAQRDSYVYIYIYIHKE